MSEIRNKLGKIVRCSKNLAGLLRHASENQATMVAISRIGEQNLEGKLCVVFENGDTCETNFADFTVLAGWILRRHRMWGADLLIDGEPAGQLDCDNEPLRDIVRKAAQAHNEWWTKQQRGYSH